VRGSSKALTVFPFHVASAFWLGYLAQCKLIPRFRGALIKIAIYRQYSLTIQQVTPPTVCY
jgi:hypothetical protein